MELQFLARFLQETLTCEQVTFSGLFLMETVSEMSDLEIFQTDGMETFWNDGMQIFQHYELETFVWERPNSEQQLLLL
jgi:hypothetical protein